MTVPLSTLSIGLGLAICLPGAFAMASPAAFGAAVRRFPRSVPWGVLLMLLGTAWFVWNVSQESISDFAAYKTPMMIGFSAIGIGACFFVQDFLAVRGFAVLLLLLAKLMLDTGRPHLSETHLTWVIQGLAYVFVVAGIWLTVSPWRLRDGLNWATASEKRLRVGCAIQLAVGLCVALLGLAKF
jgi:hypothetical protein